MLWYKKPLENLFRELETSAGGLNASEAHSRLSKYGPNRLAVKKEPFWRILFEPFRNVFVGVLLVAAIVSFISNERLDASIISIIIVINACIYYSQQYATTRVLRSLKKHSLSQVHVLRDGTDATISSLDIVPGDIMYIAEGDRVPADGRVIDSDLLRVDEASLTGESVPVHKHPATLESHHPLYEQSNMVFQGTYVKSGVAQVLVVSTGNLTEFGKIAQLTNKEHTKSPVQQKIDNLVSLIVKSVAYMGGIVFLLSLLRDIPTSEALRFALSLSVSAIPEGLPVALTVIFVLGMRRMARHKALVHSFKAIEDVGLVTTIATDKTGTLTKNELKVVDIWGVDGSPVDRFVAKTIDPGALDDPLDAAISKTYTAQPVSKFYPFDATLRLSGAYHTRDKRVYVKGSPEHIFAQTLHTKKELHAAESAMHTFTSKGYRVIAIATASSSRVPKSLAALPKLTLVGLVAFADELREEVPAAIRAAKAAGIRVRLITGDHYETAYNIGKKIGIASTPDDVIQGTDLPTDATRLASVVQSKTIFARILPQDKFRILQALKQTEITAMTGDGVNDVPALANAHVGFAMGSGSDIAKDAGGVVLLDNNFATIVRAIREGRRIFDNIRRMLFYLLSTSLGEVFTMTGALLLNLPLPVTAIQILWINLVTDTALVLPLGLEPEEDGIMQKPPRHPNDPLLQKTLILRMILVALTMAIVTLVSVHLLKQKNYTSAEIQTVSFMMLIVAQWVNAFNARSELQSSLARLKTPNHGMLLGFSIAFSLQMLVLFGPLKSVFGIQSIPLVTLTTFSLITAFCILLTVEVHKFAVRRRATHLKPNTP